MAPTLLFALDLIWPFCGWIPGRAHDIHGGRVLTAIAEVVCRRCGRQWMIHREYPGTVPWSAEVEAFFQRSIAEKAR